MSKKTLKMKDELVNSVNSYIDMKFKNIFSTLQFLLKENIKQK